MNKADYLYKTQPGYIFIFFMLLGTCFFAFVAHFLWLSLSLSSSLDVQGISFKSAKMLINGFEVLFAGLSLTCLWFVISLKIIYLNQNELIINRPLLFYDRTIPLTNIGPMKEAEESISMERGVTYKKMLIGHSAIFQLSDGKKLKISSIEVWGYQTLLTKMASQLRINKDRLRK